MRWIEDPVEFDARFLDARTCVFIDSGRERTTLVKLEFDDAELHSTEFANLGRTLTTWASDHVWYYIVLDPDPELFFKQQFGRRPLLEVSISDTAESFLTALNEPLEANPAAAIGINYREYALFSPSLQWFVHAFQTAEQNEGHLWIPREWASKVRMMYPYAHPSDISRLPQQTYLDK